MISQLRGEQQEADSPPTDDRDGTVIVSDTETGEWTRYDGDDVAEIITLPGGMVQAINIDGERHDPIPGIILFILGSSWSVWTKQKDETDRHDNISHAQKNPGGEVVLVDSRSQFVGTSIRRAKRTSILQSNNDSSEKPARSSTTR